MRVAKLQVRIAALAFVALAGSSCQTAQKPVSLLPPKSAPALTAATAAPAPQHTEAAAIQSAPAQEGTPSQAQIEDQIPSAVEKTESQPTSEASDSVADLVSKVEADFQAGLADYQAGRKDAAKQEFDNAFNALLESNLDIRSDNRLAKEFDRVVDGVNRLDLGDLTADSEGQKAEPAPIDETNGIVPAADPNVKAKAQAEIKSTHSDLPLMMTDQVAGYISYFSNRGRGTFERAFARSGRYHDMMVTI